MKKQFILISLIFLFLLPGCMGIVKEAPQDTLLAPSGEDVLVFGRIRWIQNGEERESYSSTFGWNISLQVLRAEDMKTGTIRVEKDGTFFALLPTGTYIIHRLDWRDPWDGPHWLVPKVAFKIAEDRQSYYLGTLVVDIRTKRDIIGGLWVKGFGVSIEDEEEGAMEAFRKRYTAQKVEVAKALMVHDPSIPRIAEQENQRLLLDILGSLQFGIMPMIFY